MRALAMVCAVLLAAACLPAAALAQEKDPSALWDSFPLDPTPTPGPASAPPPRRARRVRPTTAPARSCCSA